MTQKQAPRTRLLLALRKLLLVQRKKLWLGLRRKSSHIPRTRLVLALRKRLLLVQRKRL
jgi:hypothetical protein